MGFRVGGLRAFALGLRAMIQMVLRAMVLVVAVQMVLVMGDGSIDNDDGPEDEAEDK